MVLVKHSRSWGPQPKPPKFKGRDWAGRSVGPRVTAALARPDPPPQRFGSAAAVLLFRRASKRHRCGSNLPSLSQALPQAPSFIHSPAPAPDDEPEPSTMKRGALLPPPPRSLPPRCLFGKGWLGAGRQLPARRWLQPCFPFSWAGLGSRPAELKGRPLLCCCFAQGFVAGRGSLGQAEPGEAALKPGRCRKRTDWAWKTAPADGPARDRAGLEKQRLSCLPGQHRVVFKSQAPFFRALLPLVSSVLLPVGAALGVQQIKARILERDIALGPPQPHVHQPRTLPWPDTSRERAASPTLLPAGLLLGIPWGKHCFAGG